MTEPKFAQNITGKGRWYVHPDTGEMWPSVTNALSVSIAKPALVPWAVKLTTNAAVERVPQLVAAMLKTRCKPKRVADECGECFDCVVKQIKRVHRDATEKASDLGTRAHKWAENHVLGLTQFPDPEVEPFGLQFVRFLEDFGVDIAKDVEASEATVVNRKVGYAGTGDLWIRLRAQGQARKVLSLIDIKTSSTRGALEVYPEHGEQLAALAHGETILLDDGTEVPAPKGIKAHYILSLRPESYALIPYPLHGSIGEAFEAFKGSLANASWLHSQHSHKPTAAAPVKAKAVA